MDIIKRMEPVWLALVVVGALNWLLVGLFEWNLVTEIFGTGTVTDVIYVIVGLAGVRCSRGCSRTSASGRADARDRHVAVPARRTGVHTRSGTPPPRPPKFPPRTALGWPSPCATRPTI